jgi:hypothetical protein
MLTGLWPRSPENVAMYRGEPHAERASLCQEVFAICPSAWTWGSGMIGSTTNQLRPETPTSCSHSSDSTSKLPRQIQLEALREGAAQLGVEIRLSTDAFLGPPHLHGFRLGYAFLPPQRLAAALETVAQYVRKQLCPS